VLKDSGHCTIRVIIKSKDEKVEDTVKEHLKSIGAEVEGISKGFFAVDIPPDIDLDKIRSYLQAGEAKGE
jgi:hypothetical protein